MVRTPTLIGCALLASLGACASAPGDEPAEGQEKTSEVSDQPVDVPTELARLIEKTEQLGTFHALYDAELVGSEPGVGTVELVYRAPDFVRLRMSLGERGVDMLTSGTVYYWKGNLDGDPAAWRRTEVFDSRGAHRLDELFPDERPACVFFQLRLDDDTEKEQVRVDFAQGMRNGRSSPLAWLAAMKQRPSSVSSDGANLVWSGQYFRGVVARADGRLESLQVQAPESHLELRLRECSFDTPIEPQRVIVPAEAQQAEVDLEMTRAFANFYRMDARMEAFGRLQKRLDAHARAWDDATRADLRSVLAALHEEEIEARYPAWMAKLEGNFDEVAAWANGRRAADGSATALAALEQEVAERRAKVEAILAGGRAKHVESLPPAQFEKVPLGEEFQRLELAVIEAVWDERVSTPVLAAFDEKLAAALGR